MLVRRPLKRPLDDYLDVEEITYKFCVLLPNSTHVDLTLQTGHEEMLLYDFLCRIRKEFNKLELVRHSNRDINWNSDMYLEDLSGSRIREKIRLGAFSKLKTNFLMLHDGLEASYACPNMWDLTPDTDLLSELPAEYTFESALADLIDNALQALWANSKSERKLIRITIDNRKIVILDTGQGMDGSDLNSILRWGKMGSSNHRQFRNLGIGVDPPYLMPYFGMYGYGGFVATMHLGSSARVASKTKMCNKVFALSFSRDALLKGSGSESTWKTGGQIRDPSEVELLDSPHGSFTKVEIYQPRRSSLNEYQLQCRLKDIYFPYIQCDVASTMRTSTSVEFEVNGVKLIEVDGGEVAVSNLNSCNGPDFMLLLHLSLKQHASDKSGNLHSPCLLPPFGSFVVTLRISYVASVPHRSANARLKCVYFPIIEGKESIETILEELENMGNGTNENFNNFSRVSVRRLGRLLPDARWGSLPFMEPKLKRGDKVQLLRRCCMRVKCIVETDAGFSPALHKNDLAHKDPFTIALKNFGSKSIAGESLVTIEIQREGRPMSFSQLEREYQDWVYRMHEEYDEEVDCGEDAPVLVVSPSNKKSIGISSDVIRVHQVIKRKGISWRYGQHIKILKDAVGHLKKDFFGTLEYILLEGFQGDFGGEARIICRPVDCSEENGCLLVVDGGDSTLDIRGSSSFPVGLIDSGKCQVIEDDIWQIQLEKQKKKAPARIDILDKEQCRLLDIDGALPMKESHVMAGYSPPTEIVAVVRPLSFMVSSSSTELDQRFIVRNNLAMTMEISFSSEGKTSKDAKLLLKKSTKSSSRGGLHGLYIFSLEETEILSGFRNSGVYIFSFFIPSQTCESPSICKRREVTVFVKPYDVVGRWELLDDEQTSFSEGSPLCIRNGSCIESLSVACFDIYSNRMAFPSIPDVYIKIEAKGTLLTKMEKLNMCLSTDGMTLEIRFMVIECHNLDLIRPHFEASLEICPSCKLSSICVPCQVTPGVLSHVTMLPNPQLESSLRPANVIHELIFEVLDAFGNHVRKGEEIILELEGLVLQDNIGLIRKVDEQGYVNLSGLLKVVGGYGTSVRLSVSSEKMLFFKEFLVLKRELKLLTVIPPNHIPGSTIDNVVFGVVDSNGSIDEEIHGQPHTLTVACGSPKCSDIIRQLYIFHKGKCEVPVIQLPTQPGSFQFQAFHSHHRELILTTEVNILLAPKLETESISQPDGISQPQHDGSIVPFEGPAVMSALLVHLGNDENKLKQDLGEIGKQIKVSEDRMKLLESRTSSLDQEVEALQALSKSKGYDGALDILYTKEHVSKQLEEKDATPTASILRKILDDQKSQDQLVGDIIGIVALLGTVKDKRLSRILSEYIGEKYMRAVVCKSYSSARALESYRADGSKDWSVALPGETACFGGAIDEQFFAVCLDDIKPFSGATIGNGRYLDLENPTLPSGESPPGFLGFAVNIINIDAKHLHSVTTARDGLRETLFYMLFGKLQVYKTSSEMELAISILKEDAVSLDGGILSRKGVISLGHCEPDVHFPVVRFEIEDEDYVQLLELQKRILAAVSDLKCTRDEYAKEKEQHERVLQKFRKKKAKLQAFYEEKGPLLRLLPAWGLST